MRALAAALPLLTTARAVFVITIGDKHEESAAAVTEYLDWQGIAAIRRHIGSVLGAGPGEQLLAAARDQEADLLVMGGLRPYALARDAVRWRHSRSDRDKLVAAAIVALTNRTPLLAPIRDRTIDARSASDAHSCQR